MRTDDHRYLTEIRLAQLARKLKYDEGHCIEYVIQMLRREGRSEQWVRDVVYYRRHLTIN